MRLIRSICAVAFALVATATASEAAVIDYTDIFDPIASVTGIPDVQIDHNAGPACTGNNGIVDTVSAYFCQTLTYTHLVSPPFTVGVDTLTSAVLTLWLYDNADNGVGAGDKLIFKLDGVDPLAGGDVGIPDSSTFLAQFDHDQIVVTASVTDNGMLQVFLDARAGVFFFGRSELRILGETGQTVVAPEPATLALFGLAAGASAIRRKRRV